MSTALHPLEWQAGKQAKRLHRSIDRSIHGSIKQSIDSTRTHARPNTCKEPNRHVTHTNVPGSGPLRRRPRPRSRSSPRSPLGCVPPGTPGASPSGWLAGWLLKTIACQDFFLPCVCRLRLVSGGAAGCVCVCVWTSQASYYRSQSNGSEGLSTDTPERRSSDSSDQAQPASWL